MMEIRGKTISYASFKKKKTKSREDDLISQITDLEKNSNDAGNVRLLNLQKELETTRAV
jgi:hypothetical protein